jgi:hypothetical protein
VEQIRQRHFIPKPNEIYRSRLREMERMQDVKRGELPGPKITSERQH